MFRFDKVSRSARSAMALTILAVVGACSGDANNQVLGPVPVGGSIFQSYVAIGNSITAGYQ